jgi:protocatechuate 3,4-dioxygenase beta subunit
MDSLKLKRREFLFGTAGAAALLVLPGCSESGATGQTADLALSGGGMDLAGLDLPPTVSCDDTEPQILGPFYRANAPERVAIPGPTVQKAVTLRGTVRGQSAACGPIANALVEVWQADETGEYDNTSNQFLMRAVQRTGSDGSYSFTTILPGWYLNGNQFRPRHIHYKVTAPGFKQLVTQLYFKDDPYLEDDPFYHPSLVMPLVDKGDAYDVIFDIVLASA